jgi:hypothetical protein
VVELTEEEESGGDQFRKCGEDGGGAVSSAGREAEGEEGGVLMPPVGKGKATRGKRRGVAQQRWFPF